VKILVLLLSLAITTIASAHEVMVASWYGEDYRGNETTFGEIFNPDAFTAASRDYPYGTMLEVQRNNTIIYVRINDFGPSKKNYDRGIHLDLSKAAFKALGPLTKGHITIIVSLVGHKHYGKNWRLKD